MATAITGGAVGGSAAGLMTGFGGVGVAFAGGAVGVAAAPVVIGAGLIGAGTVLALKGFNVPVDEAASKAARMVKNGSLKCWCLFQHFQLRGSRQVDAPRSAG